MIDVQIEGSLIRTDPPNPEQLVVGQHLRAVLLAQAVGIIVGNVQHGTCVVGVGADVVRLQLFESRVQLAASAARPDLRGVPVPRLERQRDNGPAERLDDKGWHARAKYQIEPRCVR